jgi:hypothetical protein
LVVRGLEAIVPHFEVLTGLPPYGPLAEPFSATGGGTHREGYVVRFTDSRGGHWVGNFQPGLGGIDTAIEHPDGQRAIVIADGQGYIVDPEDRERRKYFGGQIEVVLPVAGLGILFGNGLWFEALGVSGLLWTSDRISWDGMRGLNIDGSRLTGESWDPLSDSWIPFELEVSTGHSRGGSFAVWRPT